MSRDTVSHTFKLAGAVCIVCSVIVSAAAIGWRGRQQRNATLERRKNVLLAANIYDKNKDVDEQFKPIRTWIVDLPGEGSSEGDKLYVDDAESIAGFDQRAAARAEATRISIAADDDYGGIKYRAKRSLVYVVVNENEKVEQIVLPIYGKGLWSTLYGFIALDADLQTVRGLTFYEHAETPGLGGEVDNPKWKQQWVQKRAFDSDKKVALKVLRGKVNKTNPAARFQVDGLAGATITSRGVSGMVRYWLGPNGFRPFLDKLADSDLLAARGE